MVCSCKQETSRGPEDEAQSKGRKFRVKFIVSDEEAAALIGTDGEMKNEIEVRYWGRLKSSEHSRHGQKLDLLHTEEEGSSPT